MVLLIKINVNKIMKHIREEEQLRLFRIKIITHIYDIQCLGSVNHQVSFTQILKALK